MSQRTLKNNLTISHVGAVSLAVGGAVALVWAYASAVFLLGEQGLPVRMGFTVWFLGAIVSLMAGYLSAAHVLRRNLVSVTRLANASLLGAMTVVCLLLLDTVYSSYIDVSDSSAGSADSRVIDENVWLGELYPALYHPSERNFRLHKPGVTVSGRTYGSFYRQPMQNSPLLVESVLKRNSITIRINDLGFREKTAIDDARIFALGDSFTFGWSVDEFESWPGRLEKSLGTPIYNLGVYDASPKQELELLKHVLRNQREKIQIRQLIWMIYESNDLEDNYSERRGQEKPATARGPSERTLFELLTRVPWVIKRQSVINKLRAGVVAWKDLSVEESNDPYSVDGVQLPHPLYHSQKLGPKLFYRMNVDRAGQPESYVKEHDNRPKLEVVFRDMASLADEFGFDVAVVIAPSAARLHGPFYENFPEISAVPHFVNFVARLSRSAGFDTVNLYELMKPHASSELLYFRDDDHFNQQGNALAADLIRQALFADSR